MENQSTDATPTKPSSNNTKQSKDRASNFSAVEDVLCTMAYFRASEDPICGAKQKGHVFKQKIESIYHQLKETRYEEDKRESERPNYLQVNGGIGIVPRPYPSRSGNSLHIRFNRTISPAIVKFISVVKQNEAPKSGEDIGSWRRRLLSLYHEKYGSDFKFMNCYDVAKDKPKFMSLFGVEDLTLTSSAMMTSSSSSKEDDDNSQMATKNKRPASIGNKATRPVGTKKRRK